jgi:hypothetical protein
MLSREWGEPSIILNTNLHLEPRLRMSEVMTLVSPCYFMLWTGKSCLLLWSSFLQNSLIYILCLIYNLSFLKYWKWIYIYKMFLMKLKPKFLLLLCYHVRSRKSTVGILTVSGLDVWLSVSSASKISLLQKVQTGSETKTWPLINGYRR